MQWQGLYMQSSTYITKALGAFYRVSSGLPLLIVEDLTMVTLLAWNSRVSLSRVAASFTNTGFGALSLTKRFHTKSVSKDGTKVCPIL